MSPKVMIWISVGLSAVAQIFLKQGLTNCQKTRRERSTSILFAIAAEKLIWLWAFSFVAALGLWLAGLRKLDLSYAYPLVSLGYVLVSLLSAFFFHERVDGRRWLAVAVISFGVALIAGS